MNPSVANFFESLCPDEQVLLFECALQALRDEVHDGFMREHHALEDVADWVLQELYDKTDKFMNPEEEANEAYVDQD